MKNAKLSLIVCAGFVLILGGFIDAFVGGPIDKMIINLLIIFATVFFAHIVDAIVVIGGFGLIFRALHLLDTAGKST